jgi:fibronectin type 3 domain-containing protein
MTDITSKVKSKYVTRSTNVKEFKALHYIGKKQIPINTNKMTEEMLKAENNELRNQIKELKAEVERDKQQMSETFEITVQDIKVNSEREKLELREEIGELKKL